jgi:tetratricopeptide (TPR) repeat protein
VKSAPLAHSGAVRSGRGAVVARPSAFAGSIPFSSEFSMKMRWWFAALLLVSPVSAQSDKAPKRPVLSAQSDSNAADAYYQFGLTKLVDDPHKAADAFYWATRLDPIWAEPLYARRVALMLTDKRRLVRYLEGDRRTIQSKEVRMIDSLQYRALMQSPFVYRRHDRVLLDEYFRELFDQEARRSGVADRIDESALQYFINRFLLHSDASWRAWNAYNQSNLQEALRLYTDAIKNEKDKNRAGLYADRARVNYLLGDLAAAQSDLQLAIERMRKPDEKEIVYLYQSKALFEQSIGLILEQQKNYAGAREAFGRALQEDLSFHPAHLAIARVALATADTAAALAALDLAVQVAPSDPGARLEYAKLLRQVSRASEAEAQLRKAVEIAPMYAQLYFYLAQSLDDQGKTQAALDQYRSFLARAPRSDPLRSIAERRITGK